jgi:Ca2+-binding EF-hand superfamily protein
MSAVELFILARAVFKDIDADGGGTLSFEEMKTALASMNSSTADLSQLEEILDAMDQDGNQQISYTEFLAAAVDTSKLLSGHAAVSRMAACFAAFDVNNDGKLDNEEVTELLGKIQGIDTATCSPSTKAKLAEEVKSIFKEVDTNNDGFISKQEFEEFLKLSEQK